MLTQDLRSAIAERFIARMDVKAIQTDKGSYLRLDEPWSLEDVEEHLAGKQTYGHYVLDLDSRCKVLAFDLDLDTTAVGPTGEPYDPRAAWAERDSLVRPKLQKALRALGEGLAWQAKETLDVPIAVSYSGSKGLHVYAFTGLRPAEEVRAAALSVLNESGLFCPVRGENNWKHRDCYQEVTIEVFPKQGDRKEGFGNLLRLPLGVHQRSGKKGFFLKLSAEFPKFIPDDPEKVLAYGSIR